MFFELRPGGTSHELNRHADSWLRPGPPSPAAWTLWPRCAANTWSVTRRKYRRSPPAIAPARTRRRQTGYEFHARTPRRWSRRFTQARLNCAELGVQRVDPHFGERPAEDGQLRRSRCPAKDAQLAMAPFQFEPVLWPVGSRARLAGCQQLDKSRRRRCLTRQSDRGRHPMFQLSAIQMQSNRRWIAPSRRATATAADHNSSGIGIFPRRVCLHRSNRERTSSMPGTGHVRFDERGWETGRRLGVSARAHPRLYPSTSPIADPIDPLCRPEYRRNEDTAVRIIHCRPALLGCISGSDTPEAQLDCSSRPCSHCRRLYSARLRANPDRFHRRSDH
jgi:hypothetical protein